jgi:uncharacterized membrane protein
MKKRFIKLENMVKTEGDSRFATRFSIFKCAQNIYIYILAICPRVAAGIAAYIILYNYIKNDKLII